MIVTSHSEIKTSLDFAGSSTITDVSIFAVMFDRNRLILEKI